MKRFITKLLILSSLLTVVAMPFAGTMAIAQTKDDVCAGVALTGSGCDAAGSAAADKKVNDTVRLVINVLSMVVGIVAVIMVIVGGFKYVTSSGDSNNTASAKNTILYAIIGLVVVALAQIIVKFVLKKAG